MPAAACDQRLADMATTIAGHPPIVARAYKRIIDNIARGDRAENELIRKDVEDSGILAEIIATVSTARKAAREGNK